jgi:hypothetical protein
MSDLFLSAIKYKMVVCPAITNLRTQKRTYLYNPTDFQVAHTFASMMMEYGYIPSRQMFDDLMSMDDYQIAQIFDNLQTALETITSKKLIQNARVFYENFPNVPFSLFEQRLLAISHYYSRGSFFPDDIKITQKQKREIRIDENFKFTELSFASINDVKELVFDKLLCSKNSLPVDDIEFIKLSVPLLFDEHDVDRLPNILDSIIHKEHLAIFVSIIFKHFGSSVHIKNAFISGKRYSVTDVLRIATALSGGDISLAENTKFKLNRPERKFIVELLDSTNLSFDDLLIHKNKWVKLFHCIHIGEFSPKLFKWSKVVREKFKVRTFNNVTESLFNSYIEYKDEETLISLLEHLQHKPGVFVRNISRLFIVLEGCPVTYVRHLFGYIENVLKDDSIPNKILYQLYSFIINDNLENRVFFPKGMKTKFWVNKKTNEYPTLMRLYKNKLIGLIFKTLQNRFSKLEPLGKVYISNDMFKTSINNGLRNATPGKKIVSRGTCMPFNGDNTLRMFMFWIGNDLDLAASFYSENFSKMGECSYRHTINRFSQHSGDVIEALGPDGASEYIDIDLNAARDFGVRYVGMHIYVFRDQSFDQLEKCSVGWMKRSKPKSNEMYDPKTVTQQLDLTGNAKTYTPVVFDIVENTVHFVDINGKPVGSCYNMGNQGFNQLALFKSIIQKKSLDLGTLVSLHCHARNAEIVEFPEEADVIFSLDKGITPYDYIELEKWM